LQSFGKIFNSVVTSGTVVHKADDRTTDTARGCSKNLYAFFCRRCA